MCNTRAELIAALSQLSSAADLTFVYKQAWNLHRAEAKQKFKIGDRVEFTHKGQLIVGTVTVKNPKTIKVMPDKSAEWHPGWRVGPTLLRHCLDQRTPS